MENNQTNPEVVEETVVSGSGKGLIIGAVVGTVILVGSIAYMKFIAPALAKKKAKKEETASGTNAVPEETLKANVC